MLSPTPYGHPFVEDFFLWFDAQARRWAMVLHQVSFDVPTLPVMRSLPPKLRRPLASHVLSMTSRTRRSALEASPTLPASRCSPAGTLRVQTTVCTARRSRWSEGRLSARTGSGRSCSSPMGCRAISSTASIPTGRKARRTPLSCGSRAGSRHTTLTDTHDTAAAQPFAAQQATCANLRSSRLESKSY